MYPASALVRIADQTLSLSAVRNHPGRYAKLLSRAKVVVGHAECLCRRSPLKLVIRVRSGRHHLAGWPGEGHHHAPNCPFHKIPPSLSGRSHYTGGAIAEDEAGTHIRLENPLTLRTTPAQTMRSPRKANSPSATGERRSVGLLGLLHHLWETAGLTRWSPHRTRTWRTWRTCESLLRALLDEATVNALPLSEALYLVPPYRPETAKSHAAAFNTFRDRLGQRRTTQRRGLILGEIKDIPPRATANAFPYATCPAPCSPAPSCWRRPAGHTAPSSPPRPPRRTPVASASSWSA
nr:MULTISPECIES: DUF1173 domain-containing protein [Streptomyces]